ncbi:MAG: TonB-dependent receptor [Pseudomonadota bacterium]
MRQSLWIFSSLAIFSAQHLHAQNNVLEEVIVTAQKRSESLQDVPVAVTAFTEDTIQNSRISDITDVAVMTPNLTSNANTTPFTTRLQIRGIGTSQTDPALEPSVGLFVDGIFMGRTGLGTADLTDIERIEVLQGPQGTLYGKNTNAGAISIVTKRPNQLENEGYIDASIGNFAARKITASLSAPISDTVAYRVSASIHQRDGLFDNAGSQPDQNDIDDWNIQGKLLVAPNDRLELLFGFAHIERDTQCCAPDSIQGDAVQAELVRQGFAIDENDPYDFNSATDAPDAFSMESDLLSLHIDYDLGWGSLSSITAWNDYEYFVTQDGDASQLDLLRQVREPNSGDSFSQEIRLSGSVDTSLDYQLGLFFYDQTTNRGNRGDHIVLGADFVSIADQQNLPLPFPTIGLVAQPGDSVRYEVSWDTSTIALFGQATWHLNQEWHLTAGLRWTDEEREADLFSETISTAPLGDVFAFLSTVSTPIDAQLDRSSENPDWLLKLAYDVGANTLLYASVATGTKSGNFNGVSGEAEFREFDDEETLSYELGIKSTIFDGRLRLNAAVFQTEIEQLQAGQQLPTGFGTFVSNEGEVEVAGVDVQIDAAPLANLTLGAGLMYLDTYEFTEGERAGTELPFTAELSANVSATFFLPYAGGGVYLRTDYAYMSDHFTNGADASRLSPSDTDDRSVLNGQLGWRNDNWNLSVWGRNLTDEEYAVQSVLPQAFSGQQSFFLMPPRTYGLALRYDL